MAATLDVTADHKEDPSFLGFTEGEIYYFDELTIAGLVFGFLLLGCWRSLYPRPILAGILTGIIWTYLSLLLFLVYYHSCDPEDIWLQPGMLMISGGYVLLTFAGITDLRAWIFHQTKSKRKNPD